MIATDARIESGVTVGEHTSVWHHAHIRSGATIGTGCIIGSNAYIDTGVTVGDFSKIQNQAQVFAPATLGKGVFVGPGAILTNDRNPRAVNPDLTRKTGEDWEAAGVSVLDGASIGAGAVIVAGVNVGEWALIGAGAIVTRDVLSHELVAGNPARHIGWVGKDGRRLTADGDRWIDDTGRRYAATEHGLVEVES